MIYLFYAIWSLCIILLNTTILPFLFSLYSLYDLLCPLIAILGLLRPVRESIIVILALGIITDNLSGVPYGTYLTTYFWIYAVIRWGVRYLHAANWLLYLTIVPLCVLLEDFIFLGTFSLLSTHSLFTPQNVLKIFYHFLWAIFTGPIILRLLVFFTSQIDNWQRE
jgi:cell shape-determining protein MreD